MTEASEREAGWTPESGGGSHGLTDTNVLIIIIIIIIIVIIIISWQFLPVEDTFTAHVQWSLSLATLVL